MTGTPHDPIRYQIWFPGAHATTSFEPASGAEAKRHWGTIQDIGLGIEPPRIAFHAPTRLGFTTDAIDNPRVATIVGGQVGDDRRPCSTP